MRTSGEKVRISDEAERVQSVSYSHIRSLSRLYTVMCLKGRQAKHLLWAPYFRPHPQGISPVNIPHFW